MIKPGIPEAANEIVVTDRRLLACLEDGQPDIGTLWELCMYFEFDREETADGIAAWLGEPRGQRILDCACGSGFPALELIRRGYDVTCTDGSEMMLRHFRRNARIEGLDIKPVLLDWADLPGRYDREFDVVINRGGGNYIYAGVWEEEGLAAESAMAEAIGQWAACVRPGGRLYVDTTRAQDLDRTEPQIVRHPTMVIGDHRVDIVEQVSIDRVRRRRAWESELTVDGVRTNFRRRSHYIRHEQLLAALRDLGLEGIRREPIRGEFYDVYTATRPGGPGSAGRPVATEEVPDR
ncbi:class I SAM-dependent methyltransferase [Micromonospora sp. KC606]|uniref:class I SAM-dependent methyltransferase n=1 Tax=Micromonospora sp. KC606 TaxID=2530379 RepID=UPI00104E3CCF|nr:class I SAM-dependent methyltransferase [Micromonospora sp. KC606]TDC81662.1 class I SAM-dependent methyltransferase [Micromonospora sp. KC606]